MGFHADLLLFFFFTIGTGPRRSLSLTLSDIRVYEPQTRARLGTTAHFCKVVADRESDEEFPEEQEVAAEESCAALAVPPAYL